MRGESSVDKFGNGKSDFPPTTAKEEPATTDAILSFRFAFYFFFHSTYELYIRTFSSLLCYVL